MKMVDQKPGVSEAVQEAVEQHPGIKSCLGLGLLNYSAVARWLSEEGLVKNSNETAIVSALKRYKRKTTPNPVKESNLTRLIAESTMNLQNDIAIIRVKPGYDWRRIAEKVKMFHVVEGPSVTNLIVDSRKLNPPSEGVLEVKTGLAAINVKSSKEFADTPGALYALLFPLAVKGINIEESISCYTDKILIVTENDAPEAFAALTHFIEQARSSARV